MTHASRTGAVIFVEDVARVSAFYCGVAGLRQAHADDEHAVLESDVFELVIHAIPKHLRGPASANVQPREDGAIKLFFPVANLATAREQAALLGGRLWAPGKEWEARGFRACDGVDPEGNIVQFRQDVA